MALAPARVDAVMLEARASQLFRRSAEGDAKREAFALVLACTELDVATGTETPATVRAACARAAAPAPGLPPIAAVCVRPALAGVAALKLADSPVRLAVAVGPEGARAGALEPVLAAGAREIEAALDSGAFLASRPDAVLARLAAAKSACGPALLKIVIAPRELGSFAALRRAADLALAAGADFVKTANDTEAAALPAVALLLCEALRAHARRTGREAGLSLAGHAQGPEAALGYLAIVRDTLGTAWTRPERFRLTAALPVYDAGAGRAAVA